MLREQAAPPGADGGGAPAAEDLAGTPPADTSPAGARQAGPAGSGGTEAARAAGPAGSGAADPPRTDPVSWLIALAAFAAYTTLSVWKYLRLDPGSWDLGIYTQYVDQLAHLHAPVVDIRGAGFNLLGDHFQPIVGLIAPFFRLFPTPVTLLVAQALLTAVSVVPVCRAAQALLGTGTGRAIGAAYGFSWGLQQMIVFDFHEIAFAVPLLACSLSALVRRRVRSAALWALPLVFVKEDQGLTVAAIGLVMAGAAAWAWVGGRRAGPAGLGRDATAGLGQGPAAGPGRDTAAARDGGTAAGRSGYRLAGLSPGAWARAGGLLIAWGLAGSILAIVVIIPHFNPAHHYSYWADGGVLAPGHGHLSAGHLLAQLTRSGPEKLRTTVLVLLPVAFLALRSPLAVVAVPSLALRFLSTNSYFWGTQWHYSATLMPIVFLAAIDGLARIQARAARRGPRPGRRAARYPRYAAVAMVAVAAGLAFRFPLAGLWHPQTYGISQHVRAERAAMALVPPGTTVESTLTMLAPMATRDTTYWIGTANNPVPRYILFDATSSGYTRPPSNIPAFVDHLYPGVTYRAIFESDHVYVFRILTGR
jgi:uncharacterized membrane protein